MGQGLLEPARWRMMWINGQGWMEDFGQFGIVRIGKVHGGWVGRIGHLGRVGRIRRFCWVLSIDSGCRIGNGVKFATA